MTKPSVVILTDPARCELDEAETLLQALLQLHHLGKAGVPASQAFCDHPAAAFGFIDAYAKAFPELQQQSSDLPLPEQLYSMVAEGRFGPLPSPDAGETTKLDEAPYPLYVLSLGPPEALMQALQHNTFAQSSIRILEVAPAHHSRAEAVPVAEAVASEPIARSSWLAEGSGTMQQADEDIVPPDAAETSYSLRLPSVEVDLDRIEPDRYEGRNEDSRDDPTLEPPDSVLMDVSYFSSEAIEAGTSQQNSASEGRGGGSGTGEAVPSVSVAAIPVDPSSEINRAPPSEPAATVITSDQVRVAPQPATETSSSDWSAGDEAPHNAPDAPTDGQVAIGGSNLATLEEPARSETQTGAPTGPSPFALADGHGAMINDTIDEQVADDNEHTPDRGPRGSGAPCSAVNELAFGTSHEERSGFIYSSSFDGLEEDVLYPASGSCDWTGDVLYDTPPDLSSENAFSFVEGEDDTEVVDIEAICSRLSTSTEPEEAGKFDVVLMRHLGSDSSISDRTQASNGQSNESTAHYTNPDEEESYSETLAICSGTGL